MSDSSEVPPSDAELAKLREENERLREQLSVEASAPPAKVRTGSRGKTVLSALLIIFACLLAPLSVVSVWAKSQVTDTDRYVATVAPLATNPQIQDAVAARITNEIFKYISIEEITTTVVDALANNRGLSEQQQNLLKGLATPITSGVESFVEDQVNKLVESPQFAELWNQVNQAAHASLVKLLSGDDTGALQVDGNAVVLNLAPILDQVKQQLVDRGFGAAANIPDVNTDIVLFQSDSIGQMQALYSALEKVGFWMPIILALIAIIGIFVANQRHVAVTGLGVGLILAMGVALLLIGAARIQYMGSLPSNVDPGAAEAVFDTLVLFLRESLIAGFVAGFVLAFAGYFVGPTNGGKATRSFFDRAAGAIQAQLYGWGATMTSVRGFVRSYATGLRILVTVIALAIIFLTQYRTAGLIIWTTVGLLITLFVIQVFASDAQAAADSPADDDKEIVGAGA